MQKSVSVPRHLEKVVEAAGEALALSRAPYSGISVGAAALLGSGRIIKGANWESPSYPAGVCAERAMLSAVFASGADAVIVAVAVVASAGGAGMDISPCGICRQSLLDAQNMQGTPFEVIFRYGGGYVTLDSAAELLPFAFSGI